MPPEVATISNALDTAGPWVSTVVAAVLVYLFATLIPQMRGVKDAVKANTKAIETMADNMATHTAMATGLVEVLNKIATQQERHDEVDKEVIAALKELSRSLYEHRINEGGD